MTDIYSDIVDLVCPVCKKSFVPAAEHVYRTVDRRPVCSWTCLCKYRRDRAIRSGVRAVLQLDVKGNVLKAWQSAKDAAVANGLDPANIRACCNGKQAVSGGYRWMWKRDASGSDTLLGCILQSAAETEK